MPILQCVLPQTTLSRYLNLQVFCRNATVLSKCVFFAFAIYQLYVSFIRQNMCVLCTFVFPIFNMFTVMSLKNIVLLYST